MKGGWCSQNCPHWGVTLNTEHSGPQFSGVCDGTCGPDTTCLGSLQVPVLLTWGCGWEVLPRCGSSLSSGDGLRRATWIGLGLPLGVGSTCRQGTGWLVAEQAPQSSSWWN